MCIKLSCVQFSFELGPDQDSQQKSGKDPGFQFRKFEWVPHWHFWKMDRRAKQAGRALHGYFPAGGFGGGGGGRCRLPNGVWGSTPEAFQMLRIFTCQNGWFLVDSQTSARVGDHVVALCEIFGCSSVATCINLELRVGTLNRHRYPHHFPLGMRIALDVVTARDKSSHCCCVPLRFKQHKLEKSYVKSAKPTWCNGNKLLGRRNLKWLILLLPTNDVEVLVCVEESEVIVFTARSDPFLFAPTDG